MTEHGRADWAGNAALGRLWGVQDMGELAARLGADSVYDRRGWVIWSDHFAEGLLPWIPLTSGTGGLAVAVITNSYRGAVSCRLAAGSDGDKFAKISHSWPLLDYGKVGIEWVISPDVSEWEYVRAYTQIRKAGQLYDGQVRLYLADNSLRIMGPTGAIVTIAAGLPLLWAQYVWHVLKLVVDASTLAYSHVLIDSHRYDLSAYALRSLGAYAGEYMFGEMSIAAIGGSNPGVYVGQCVVTMDEA